MDDIFAWFKSLPWAAWIAPVATAAGGLLTWGFQEWIKRRSIREDRSADAEKAAVEHRNKLELSQGPDLTARFTALMDGYEGRIKDLTVDLTTARAELRAVNADFEAHRKKCRACPYSFGLEGNSAT